MTQNTEQNVRTRVAMWAVVAPTGKVISIHDDEVEAVRAKQSHWAAVRHCLLEEDEARGAEEQRRKDAEGQEPVRWERLDSKGDWHSVEHAALVAQLKAIGVTCRALFDRPANVAALEARVKELEGALKEAASALKQVKDGERGGYNARNGKFVSLQMSDGERADIIHSDVTAECEGTLETVRAALTREGGV